MEELGAFSLTPDVGAGAGVGAKSGLSVFISNPRSTSRKNRAKEPVSAWASRPPAQQGLSFKASEISGYSGGHSIMQPPKGCRDQRRKI